MKITFILLLALLSIAHSSIDTANWELFDGNAMYVAITDKTMWKLVHNNSPQPGGYPMYQWNIDTQTWDLSPGYCLTLALASNYLYCATLNHELYRKPNLATSTSWSYLYQYGNDIKVGSNDNIWYISNTATPGGFEIYKYDGTTQASTKIAGTGGVRVGVAPDGNAWIVTDTGAIKSWTGTAWVDMPGQASDIVIGNDGVPFIITKTVTDGGYTVQKWSASTNSWTTVAGVGGVSLGVDGRNTPYVVTDSYLVYRPKGKASDFCPTCKLNCAACADPTTCLSCRITLCLSNNQCMTCADGTYPSPATSTCAACPSGCETCTSTGCLTCKAGYLLKNNRCEACPSGTYFNTNTCSACPDHCVTCTDSKTCKQCDNNFELDNKLCTQCPADTTSSGITCEKVDDSKKKTAIIAGSVLGAAGVTTIGLGLVVKLIRRQRLSTRRVSRIGVEQQEIAKAPEAALP